MYEVKGKESFSRLFYIRVSGNSKNGRSLRGAVATAIAGVGGKINILNKKIFSTFTVQVLY